MSVKFQVLSPLNQAHAAKNRTQSRVSATRVAVRPAVVILGFVVGSAAAITFALLGTAIVFVVLRSDYPRLQTELNPLLVSVALFSLLTIAAGSSFYGELRQRAWRRLALLALCVVLAAVVAYHAWPKT